MLQEKKTKLISIQILNNLLQSGDFLKILYLQNNIWELPKQWFCTFDIFIFLTDLLTNT